MLTTGTDGVMQLAAQAEYQPPLRHIGKLLDTENVSIRHLMNMR